MTTAVCSFPAIITKLADLQIFPISRWGVIVKHCNLLIDSESIESKTMLMQGGGKGVALKNPYICFIARSW